MLWLESLIKMGLVLSDGRLSVVVVLLLDGLKMVGQEHLMVCKAF